jgi:hypothetical protein
MSLETPIKTAFMGIAAINIGGYTMNSSLDIPVELNEGSGSSKHFKPWDADRLQHFKRMYDINNLSVIIVDEISMVKPWMLAYLDERMKEATQVFDKPCEGIGIIMFGDFDQQPPIGGSSLPHFAMKVLEKEYQKKNKIFFTKTSRQDAVEMNSTLCRIGARLFESASCLKFISQHRCAKDPQLEAILNKMNSGQTINPRDFDLYRTVSESDLKNLDEFLFGTIIVTGNYERQELNSYMANLWAKHFNTHVIRWKRKINYDKWKGKPRSDNALNEAEKQCCFYELFIPMCPAYLTYNINLSNDLANGTLVREHFLAFDTIEEKLFLDSMIATTPPGETITLPHPPTAINVELYADFPDDTEKMHQDKENNRKKWNHGSITQDGKIVIPIDKTRCKFHTESIRSSSLPFFYNASTVPIADYFPIELGFCITVPKAQGRTIHRLVASLSEHPSPFLRFKYEQIYVLLSRITGRHDLSLLLKNSNQNTLNYISKLTKDPLADFYFAGLNNKTVGGVSRWNSILAAKAAGFTES